MELGPRWAAVDMMAQIPNVISHFHSLLGWPSVCLGLEAGIRGVLWLTRAAVSTFSQSAAKESLEITLFSHSSASPHLRVPRILLAEGPALQVWDPQLQSSLPDNDSGEGTCPT